MYVRVRILYIDYTICEEKRKTSLSVQVESPSHQLETNRQTPCFTTLKGTGAVKPRKDPTSDVMFSTLSRRKSPKSPSHIWVDPELSDVDTYGRDLEMQFSISQETLSGVFIRSTTGKKTIMKRIKKGINSKNSTVTHHILIAPPTNKNIFTRFPKAIYFLIDRSSRLSWVWSEIVNSIEVALSRLTESDTFGITLFDENLYMTWGTTSLEAGPSQLYPATADRKTSMIDWLSVYRPDRNKPDSLLDEPLCKALKALCHETRHKSSHIPICVLLNASHHPEEKQTIRRILEDKYLYDTMDTSNSLKPRIFGVSLGGGSNPQITTYLSSVSRGKSIHILDPNHVKSELVGFLSEIDSPICRDLTVDIRFKNAKSEFIANEMLFPYPVPDRYADHPAFLKVTIPNDESHQIQEIQMNGMVIGENGSMSLIDIPVTMDDENGGTGNTYDDSFDMTLYHSSELIDCLHSHIWYMNYNSGAMDNAIEMSVNAQNDAVIALCEKANDICDETNLCSPTRLMQSVQETLDPITEQKADMVDNAMEMVMDNEIIEELFEFPERCEQLYEAVIDAADTAALSSTISTVAVDQYLDFTTFENSLMGEGVEVGCCEDGECECDEFCGDACVIL